MSEITLREFQLTSNINIGQGAIEFHSNGDIFIKGVLCDNNKEIVQAVEEFFLNARSPIKFCLRCMQEMDKMERECEENNEP